MMIFSFKTHSFSLPQKLKKPELSNLRANYVRTVTNTDQKDLPTIYLDENVSLYSRNVKFM